MGGAGQSDGAELGQGARLGHGAEQLVDAGRGAEEEGEDRTRDGA